MAAGRDVDVVLRPLLVEAGALGVVVELAVDLLEVPGVLQLHDVEDHLQAKGYLGRDSQAGRHNPVDEEF